MSMFYEAYGPKEVTRGDLPHWSQLGSLHFVTFRLADSIPAERVRQIQSEHESWSRCHAEPLTVEERKEHARLFRDRMQEWLDDCSGECLLADERCMDILAASFDFFAGKRYLLDHWVIMPNHVHVMVMPIADNSLADIMHSWKSFTSHRLNKIYGRHGQLWQHESFDHVVRSHAQLERFRAYIVKNASSSRGRARLSTGVLAESK